VKHSVTTFSYLFHKEIKLIQYLFVYLQLVWSKTSKLAVTFTSKLKNLLSRLGTLLMKLLPLAKRLKESGKQFLASLGVSLNLKLQSLLEKLKNLTLLLLTKLKSKLK